MTGGANPNWVNTTGSGNTDGDNDPAWRTTANTLTYNQNDAATLLSTGQTGSSTETRPKNAAMNYIIKAKN